ncbi:MAG: hypothetical protein CVV24_00215 [Ignavibacteriae bacterium HGW-Ignavibacteriae-3]|nr:MAG: hypothetical protein CVV24_00215 [Ignavibacteriae bacterium HGW-Ignavibacteriae-3]
MRDKKHARKYLRRIFFILIPVIILNSKAESQTASNYELPSGLTAFSLSDSSEIQISKKYFLPAAEIVGLNFAVWGYHRYLSGEGWSNISWESIKYNFKNGFEWDVDGYLVNQFWHPYHGSNYFNLARSNGLNFWESALYSLGGSLMWEYFMENERPSYNDIVNTPVSGTILGEISFRVSNLIIDESSSGLERFIREFTSTLLNPMQGFNRMITGEMWKSGIKNIKPDFSLTLSTGVHNVFFGGRIKDGRIYLSLGGDLIYGDPLKTQEHRKPFDYFNVHTELHIAENDNIVGISASGVLWDSKFKMFANSNEVIGIYKEIDIHINTVYKLSATSVSSQIISRIPISNSLALQNYFGVSAILMGGTNSQYSSTEGKDYNIGPGASAKIGSKLILKNSGEFYLNYKRYWIHTLSGARGEEFIGLLNIGLNFKLVDGSTLGTELLLYERSGDYKNFPDTKSSNIAVRMYMRHNI